MTRYPDPAAFFSSVASDPNFWTRLLREFNKGRYLFVQNPDYGAKGDGVNDDGAAMNACIADSNPSDTIFWHPGTYLTSIPVIRKPNRNYIGLGGGWNDSVIIKVKDGSSANFQETGGVSGVFVPESWNNNLTVASGPVTVMNFMVHGNRTNNATGQHAGFILGHGEYWSRYENLYSRECMKDGILFTPLGKNGSSLMASGISDIRLKDLLATENGGSGIRCVKSGGAFVTDVTVEGNVLSFWNDGSGVDVDEAANWRITGSIHIWMNGKHGLIFRDGSYASVISHIYVEDFGRLGASGEFLSGIEIKSFNGRSPTLHDCTVSVNTPLTGVTHRGIVVNANDTNAHAWVHDNEVRVEGTATSSMWGFVFDNGSGGSKLSLHEHANHAYGFVAGQDKGYFGTATYAFDPPRRITATALWNPTSIINGGSVTTTITVTGAAVGDLAMPGLSTLTDTGNISITARVTGPNTVSVTIRNDSGATIDPVEGTLRVSVLKF